MANNSVIAVDLGGTNLRAARIDASGRVLSRAKNPTPTDAGDPAILIKAIINAIESCQADHEPIPNIAVVVPGSTDAAAEVVVKAPHLPGLNGYHLKKHLEERLGVKAVLENDANAAAVGEMWLGAAQGCRSVVCLTLGTGIGGGIILDGKLWRGADGSAGEIGHTTVEFSSELKCQCGNNGCLELFASATAITRMATTELAKHPDSILRSRAVTARNVYDAALEGDKLSQKIFETVGTYLGIAIANLLNVLNPEVVVIGGGVANGWSLFQSPMHREAQQRAFSPQAKNVRIFPAKCGDDAGLLGAARLALSGNMSDTL